MAEKSDVRKEITIVWKTEKSLLVPKRVSSFFSLFGATWQLAMGTLTIFPITVYLHRIGKTKPRKDFSLLTSIQSVKRGYNFRSSGVMATISQDSTQLWCSEVEEATRKTFDWLIDTEVTVVCVLTGIPTATSDFLSETVEVMTQTDFHSSLSIKNLLDVKLSSDADLDTLSRDLGKLLEDKFIPDVNLKCGGRTIAAHKAILAARSQVFSAMFQSQMLESETDVVDIADVDAQVLEIFLKYVYSGKLPLLSDEVLPSLYAAGDKYAVSSLITTCSERMIYNLTRMNCLDTLFLANAHSDQCFKNAVINFILNQMEILKSQQWVRFSKDNPILSVEVLQTVVQQKLL